MAHVSAGRHLGVKNHIPEETKDTERKGGEEKEREREREVMMPT